MNWEAVGAIAGLVGVALVIVSLIYVGVQVRQTNRNSQSQARQSLIDTFGELSMEMAKEPELLEIIAAGVRDWAELPNMEKTKFDLIMARYLLNLHRGILQYRDGALDRETLDFIGNQMMISVMMPGGKEWFHDTQYASREVKEYIAQRLKSPETLPLPAERTSPHWLALAD